MRYLSSLVLVKLLLAASGSLLAQPLALPSVAKYWIYLADKDPLVAPSLSPQALANRQARHLPVDETDKPVSAAYIAQLRALGIAPTGQSRWFNAVSAPLTAAQRQQVARLPFVRDVQALNPGLIITSIPHASAPKLAAVMTQMQADSFAAAGLTGRFVQIGVIDAGFFGADSMSWLKPIAQRGGFRQIRDFVNRAGTHNDLIHTRETRSDDHGTEVLGAIGGYDPVGGLQLGLGYDASFYLARTDAGNREFRGEEDNWVQAIEWMDSLGVRLINTSLGYAKGFTNPRENYAPAQMDGHTSLISRAAQMAVDKKGMLVIVSAGNEGDDHTWRVISTPADAEGVLAVGATNNRLWNRIGYSSIGPEALPYLKPNISCFSLYGTSLAAPAITGFAACLMQANPKLTNKQLRDIIQQSAHLYPYGNNYVGYGVPQASRALLLLRGQPLPNTTRLVKATGKQIDVDLSASVEQTVSVFRKKSARHVLRQEALRANKGKLVLRRLTGETHTTVDMKDAVIEVVWE
ncbi:S8 family serine peptidase [Fibrella sp. HMF5335]|uniref:S8 family serine peptidase n=1 Tax=Fibrella rubiginis TaxID=2817060 RepID=A0A939K6M7_9BACT|nr:S8 family serine peptidase [Fibrella rubiginis]MBO0939008.1 S8 family serine peptidase [Fibrella rubiginis]